jgi:hypothetical protein
MGHSKRIFESCNQWTINNFHILVSLNYRQSVGYS